MPKMKTNSSAKKRFSVTGSGKIKRSYAFKRHHLELKSQSMKRKTRGMTVVCDADDKVIRKFMPYIAK